MKSSPRPGIPAERITEKIYLIRGHRVMLDQDLASLYQVETKALKQAVKRNIERFPDDFLLTLSRDEFDGLRSQIVTTGRG
ncbi:MAG: ORF6N domain-containing protein [Desulfobacterales bacterium]